MTINSLQEMRDYLDRFSYKPYATIRAEQGMDFDVLDIIYCLPVNDVNRPEFKDMIQTIQGIALPVGESVMDQMIESAWRYLELHEMNEWLKKDDVCVIDPHPELKSTDVRGFSIA